MLINYIKKYLSNDDLNQLQSVITETERETSGEIRLCFRLKRNIRERKMSTRDIAIADFFELEMDKTRDGTGVLVYIFFKERLFEIVADKNIYEKIEKSKFDFMVQTMILNFKNKNYIAGIAHCIREIGDVMKKEFPRKPDDLNELPDDIVIK
ncbi:MAG: TPM domain-containing protein [Ignavibacteria bacterium]|nr:TPM domain-containing protein [Ignavibacteria bacterium]